MNGNILNLYHLYVKSEQTMSGNILDLYHLYVKMDIFRIFLTAAFISALFPSSSYAQQNSQTGCLSSGALTDTIEPGSGYMLYDEGNPVDGSINLRAEPTTSAPVVYVATSRAPITIFEQVYQNDGYCWFRIDVLTFSEANPNVLTPVGGWVRSDLTTMAWD